MTAIPIRLRGETLPMTTELLDKYNVQGPRYTSYPTAPEWTDYSPAEYDRFGRPATERLVSHLPRRSQVPVVLFASGSAHLVDSFLQMPVDVLSIDWKLPLDEARVRANGKALQGNVDPGVLLGTPEGVRDAVFAARRAAGPVGHIENLGHGILPPTPPENVAAFVAAARAPLS